MAGNKNSGRRPSLETLLADIAMSSRLVIEQIHGLATAHNENGKTLLSLHLTAREQQQVMDAAINDLRRERIGWDGTLRRSTDFGMEAAA